MSELCTQDSDNVNEHLVNYKITPQNVHNSEETYRRNGLNPIVRSLHNCHFHHIITTQHIEIYLHPFSCLLRQTWANVVVIFKAQPTPQCRSWIYLFHIISDIIYSDLIPIIHLVQSYFTCTYLQHLTDS